MTGLHARCVLKDMLQVTESANARLNSLSGMKPFKQEPFRPPAIQPTSESALRGGSRNRKVRS